MPGMTPPDPNAPLHGWGAARVGFVPRLVDIDGHGAEVSLVRTSGPDVIGQLRKLSTNDAALLRLTLSDGTNLQAEGRTNYDALHSLQDVLEQDNLRLRTCGNCVYFTFSEMSWQMSGGTKGYCTVGKARPEDAGRADVVSVFDVCDMFHYGPESTWS